MSSDTLTCSACLQPEADWKGAAKGPCGHSMCMPCFMTWIRLGKPSCPLCRNDFVAVDDAAALVADERAFVPDMVYQQEQAEAWDPFAHRQALRQASRARRLTFLYDKQDEFRAHCLVCTDAECRTTHSRRLRWLERGKLVPCPPSLSSLPKTTIGLLLSRRRTGYMKSQTLHAAALAMGESLNSYRMFGFEQAIHAQLQAAVRCLEIRKATSGSVAKRSVPGGNLDAIVACHFAEGNPPHGSKVFQGFTPPKHGARVGDLWVKDEQRGVCVGFNLWRLNDGNKTYLDKTTKKWVIVAV